MLVGDDLPPGAPTIAIIGASQIPVAGVFLGECEVIVGGAVATAAMVPSAQEGMQTFSMALPLSSEGVFIGFQMAYIDPQTSDLLLSNGVEVVVQSAIDWAQVGGSSLPDDDPEHEVLVELLQEGSWHEAVENQDEILIHGSDDLNGNTSAWSSGFLYMGPNQAFGHVAVYAEDLYSSAAGGADAKLVFENEWYYEPNIGVQNPHPTARATGAATINSTGSVGGWNGACYLDAKYTTEVSPLVPPTVVEANMAGATQVSTISVAGVSIPMPYWSPGVHTATGSANLSSQTIPTGLVRTTVFADLQVSLTASAALFTSGTASADFEGAVKTLLTLGDDAN